MSTTPPKQHTSALELPSAAALLQQLQAAPRVRVLGWSITADGDTLWASNPYGVDVGQHTQDLAGCSAILARIGQAEQDPTLEQEWGHL